MKSRYTLPAVLVLASGIRAAFGWDTAGLVSCISGTPMPGVFVVVTNTSGTYSNGNWTTTPEGGFILPLAGHSDTYVEYVNAATLPAGSYVCEPAGGAYTFSVDANHQEFLGSFSICGACTNSPPPPPPCVCIDAALGLGSAAGLTVFELGASKVDITGPAGGIIGNIAIAPNGRLSITGSEYVTGDVLLGANAQFKTSSSGTIGAIEHNVDLSGQIAAAYAANVAAASMPCSQTIAKLDGKTVTAIAGVSGLNVICVKDITINGGQVTLSGPADARFIINVSGKFALNGGGKGPHIVVDQSTGLTASDVLFNVIGKGEDVALTGGGGGVHCCNAVIDGTILAPYRKIRLSPGLVNGEVISGLDISIVSGASVRCPSCP